MELKKIYTIDNIDTVFLGIPISVNKNNLFDEVVKSLEVKNLKTTKTYRTNLVDFLDEIMPQITFNGDGFGFGLTKTKFSAQFLEPSEFAPVGNEMPLKKESPSQVFTKENLDNVSSDFNYILGLIFGKLGLNSDNYELNFGMRLSKQGYFVKELDYLLKQESKLLFGNITGFHLKGFKINVEENMFNTKVQTEYRLNETKEEIKNKNYCNARAEFKFKYSGPIDFFKFVNAGMDRLNNLAVTIIGDINESR